MMTINQIKSALLPFIDEDMSVVASTVQVADSVHDFYNELEDNDRNGDEDGWFILIAGRKHFVVSVFTHGGQVCLGLEGL